MCTAGSRVALQQHRPRTGRGLNRFEYVEYFWITYSILNRIGQLVIYSIQNRIVSGSQLFYSILTNELEHPSY